MVTFFSAGAGTLAALNNRIKGAHLNKGILFYYAGICYGGNTPFL